MGQEIPNELLSLLCCPQCRHPVAIEGDRLVCTHPACGLRYPVRDGIPVMLIEEAEPPKPAQPETPAGR